MMKQFRSAFILLGVMGVLAAVAFWDDWKTKKDEGHKATENKLISLNEDQISEIHYVSAGATDAFDKGSDQKQSPFEAHLKKQDGQWQLSLPLAAKADEGAVKNLLTALKDYKYDRSVTEDKAKWKEFGLDPANRKIVLTYTKDSKVETLELFVGGKAPVGYSAYVATNSSPKVFLGSQHILTATTKNLADFRDKTVATVNEKDLKGLTVDVTGKGRTEIAKREGKYVIIAPEPLAADEGSVKELIDELNRTKAADIVDSPSKEMIERFSSANLKGKLTWSLDGVPPVTLLFAEHEKGIWAAFDPKQLAMKLPEDAGAKLLRGLSELRDRRIFLFSAKSTTAVEIDGIVFKRIKDDWFEGEDAAKSPPQGKPKGHIQSLLVDLEFAKGDEFIATNDKSVKSLSAPQRRIKIEFSPESKTESLSIEAWDDPKDKEKTLIKHSAGKYIFRASKALFSNTTETTIKSASESASPLNFGKADDLGDPKDDKSAN